MGIIEDMIVKAKSAVEVLGEKTGNFVDISKLNISVSEAKCELKKKYEALGKLVYESRREDIDNNVDIEKSMNEIDLVKENIKKIEDEISMIKNQLVCSGCGKVNSSDAKYCSGCGAELAIKCRVIKKDSADVGNVEEQD